MMQEQAAQGRIAGQRCGLEELTQLVNLNSLVNILKPLPCLFNGFLRRSFDAGFEIAAGGKVDYEFPGESGVEGVEAARLLPLSGKFCELCHDFMIQLETSSVKRAATAVRDPLY